MFRPTVKGLNKLKTPLSMIFENKNGSYIFVLCERAADSTESTKNWWVHIAYSTMTLALLVNQG